ncbi:hypothetical protein K469DRAFT_810030 [Zopfia rhizophila CBS 207.26]|uniref:Uncharacterized protein n=1 Tax=Zopfia rhizophila CBS 207.26 TaxID=1314779 RepID=A0A6A6DFI8_9PEZI|nr:hypothetical protein K469DRAFT_810030 [Zopfia rhizophila CBS 207.26]
MGPLMDNGSPLGVSAVFAWCISRGEKVTVLSPPPPERFHPSGLTNYQAIEEPILKKVITSHALFQIEMVHPTVKRAENFSYQVWPVDNTATWITVFGTVTLEKQRWRMTTLDPSQTVIRKNIEAMEESKFGKEPIFYQRLVCHNIGLIGNVAATQEST